MDDFKLSLSDEERRYLLDTVHSRIDLALRGQMFGGMPLPPPGTLYERFGAFVTLKRQGQLRGCIGRLASSEPLFTTVGKMAEAAALHDSRFPPLTLPEFQDIEIEVSILGPITLCPNPTQIVIGRHGLIMRKGNRQGILLPQVPVEWEWDRETFLAQACRKAGLPPDAWHDANTEIYWFEAYII